ncbi:uncharacterized protein [Nicotiana sylvestris]|uniref:Uncharacterized protein LOC104228735 n=1 Tax=Nicotiana sylvestris TaxID=4096 RepID=A0A1U7WZC4_NICSY|nr:PREDICTED: uncharacterized protein LOC104228735 [Nicotiana sylvestris]
MGSSLFWYDNWTGLGELYFIVPQDFGIDESINNVMNVVEEGGWNVNKLLESLPEEYVSHIMENIKPPVVNDKLDIPYWMLEPRGHFSLKSAWEYLRRRDEPREAYKKICVWKAKLPLDDFMRRLGYIMPSKCWYCTQPEEETLHHLFFSSDTARNVWRYFLLRVGINMQGLTMHQAITKCWKIKDLLTVMENHTARLKVDKVIWEFPDAGWLKVNTDGASRGNPSRSVVGYCVRDEYGDVVAVVGKEIHETTNTEAEAIAIVEALRFYRMQHFPQVCVKTDSMLMKKIMEGVWKPPWSIAEHVEEIMQLLNGGNYVVSHIYREGNKLTDHIANYALDVGDIKCQDFWQLDVQGRNIVNKDKLQCPYLMVKVPRS